MQQGGKVPADGQDGMILLPGVLLIYDINKTMPIRIYY